MSETEKTSKKRKERGLNVRVVQERKEKKTDDVRANVDKVKAEDDIGDEIKWRVGEEIEEKTEKKLEDRTEEKIENKIEDEIEKKIEEEARKVSEELVEHFESLSLHIDTQKAPLRIIPRDVTREIPVTDSAIAKEASKEDSEERLSVKVTDSIEKPEPEKKLTAKKLKEQEIKKAVSIAKKISQPQKSKARRVRIPKKIGTTRAVLTVVCLSTIVFAVIYYLNLNSSNISIRVAAIQSGIEAVYPSYVPRGYTLSDVISSSGRVTLKYKSDNAGYTIVEERTTWNSDGLLSNFVKPTYGDEHIVLSEQGLTIYVGDRWAVWVNGGMIYKLIIDSGNLTKKQIKTIATSL